MWELLKDREREENREDAWRGKTYRWAPPFGLLYQTVLEKNQKGIPQREENTFRFRSPRTAVRPESTTTGKFISSLV